MEHEDLNVLATLFVNAMIVIAEAIEDAQSSEALETSVGLRSNSCG